MTKEEIIIGILWAALMILSMLYQRSRRPMQEKRDDEHTPLMW